MTVDELLGKLNAAFPSFNARALEAWGGVFRDVCGRHEGPTLKSAYTAVLSSFTVAKSKALHPVPADFAEHLPKGPHRSSGHGDVGPPIRAALEARSARSDRLFKAWHAEQGLKIKAARHQSIYGACVLEVMDLCRRASERTGRLILTAEQIAKCEQRALSSERAHRWPPAKTNEGWDDQIEQIRAEWAAQQPQQEAA